MDKGTIDSKRLYAALDELRPIRRQVFILYIWERMAPMQIVDYFAQEGLALSAEQVREHIEAAFRHCQRRLNESELGGRLNAVPHSVGRLDTDKGNELPVSEHIWLDDQTPAVISLH